MDFPYLGSIVYALLKKPPAQLKNYIWDEEKHIWGILKRLKCNFGPPRDTDPYVVTQASIILSTNGLQKGHYVYRTVIFSYKQRDIHSVPAFFRQNSEKLLFLRRNSIFNKWDFRQAEREFSQKHYNSPGNPAL